VLRLKRRDLRREQDVIAVAEADRAVAVVDGWHRTVKAVRAGIGPDEFGVADPECQDATPAPAAARPGDGRPAIPVDGDHAPGCLSAAAVIVPACPRAR